MARITDQQKKLYGDSNYRKQTTTSDVDKHYEEFLKKRASDNALQQHEEAKQRYYDLVKDRVPEKTPERIQQEQEIANAYMDYALGGRFQQGRFQPGRYGTADIAAGMMQGREDPSKANMMYASQPQIAPASPQDALRTANFLQEREKYGNASPQELQAAIDGGKMPTTADLWQRYMLNNRNYQQGLSDEDLEWLRDKQKADYEAREADLRASGRGSMGLLASNSQQPGGLPYAANQQKFEPQDANRELGEAKTNYRVLQNQTNLRDNARKAASYDSNRDDPEWDSYVAKGRAMDSQYNQFQSIAPEMDKGTHEYQQTMQSRFGANRNWEFLKPDEREMYEYLLGKYGTEQAEQYLKDMQLTLDKRAYDDRTAKTAEQYANADAFGKIGMNAASVPANVFGGAVAGAVDVAGMLTGKFNPYSNIHSAQQYATETRELTSEDIASNFTDAEGNVSLTGKVVSNTYQAIMSGLDSTLGAVTIGQFGAPITAKYTLNAYTASMGLSSASQKARELYEDGASKAEIAWGAIGSGVIEAAFEDISLEKFATNFLNTPLDGFTDWFKKTLVQAGVEGSEELFTEIANSGYQALMQSIAGTPSDEENKIRDLLTADPTMTREEAKKLVAKEYAQELFWAFYGGAISGGAMGGAGGAINATVNHGFVSTQRNRQYNADAKAAVQNPSDMLNKAFNSNNETVRQMAEQYSTRLTEGDKVSKRDYRNLAREIDNANRNEQKSSLKESLKDTDTVKVGGVEYNIAEKDGKFTVKETFDSGDEETSWTRSTDFKTREEAAERIAKQADRADFQDVRKAGTVTVIDENGQEVEGGIPTVASIKDGEMMLNVPGVGEVKAENVQHYSDAEAAVFDVLSTTNMTAAAANEVIEMLRSDGITEMAQATAVKEAYDLGLMGAPESAISQSVYGDKLREQTWKAAFYLGRDQYSKNISDAQTNVKGTIAGQKAAYAAEKHSNVHRGIVFDDTLKVSDSKGKELTINGRKLNDQQKTTLRFAEFLAKCGVNVRIIDSDATFEKTGKRGENGSYNPETGEIQIDLYAGKVANGKIMMYTATHEFTHWLEEHTPEKFKAYTNALFEALGKTGADVQGDILKEAKRLASKRSAKYDGKSFTEIQQDANLYEKLIAEARSEVIARYSETMLTDSDAMQQIVDKLAAKEPKLLKQISNWFKDWVKKMKAAYSGIETSTGLGAEGLKAIQEHAELAELFADMAADALANQGGIAASEVREQMQERDNILNHERYIDKHMGDLDKYYNAKEAKVSLKELTERYNKVIDIWKQIGGELNSQFLDAWNNQAVKKKAFTIFKAQQGYKYNAELSSMCKKGIPLFEAIDTIVKKEVLKQLNTDTIGKAEKEILYDILKSHSFEIPCAICYVEQARQREGAIINAFLNGKVDKDKNGNTTKVKLGWNQVLADVEKRMGDMGVSYKFPKADRSIATDNYTMPESNMTAEQQNAFYEALRQSCNAEIERYNRDEKPKNPKKPIKDTSTAAVNAALKGTLPGNLSIYKALFLGQTHGTLAFKMDNDLLYSSMTTRNLATAHPSLYKLFNMQGGVNGYKTKQGTVAYMGDMLGKKWSSASTRKEGGIRNQSNSDFMMYTLLDQVQMYVDLTAKGYYLQAYTKVLAELKLFGKSGAKINASLIPAVHIYRNADGSIDMAKTRENAGLDANGNPIYDDIEGINHNEAFVLLGDKEYSKSIAGICIGYSDKHIIKLLGDKRVQEIIGYHDKTDDPDKRYRGARYAKNYNGQNEVTHVKADGTVETLHVNFNTYIQNAEKMFKKSGDTFTGTAEFGGKTYDVDHIPNLAADMYLADYRKPGYAPAYDIPGIVDHENYYKLLADFGLKDSEGHYAPHQKVNFQMPDTVPCLVNGKVEQVSSKDYIKAELAKEMNVRDDIAAALSDESEDGIIPQFVKKVNEMHNGEDSNKLYDSRDILYSVREDIVDVNGKEYDNVVQLDKSVSKRVLSDPRRMLKYVSAVFAGKQIVVKDIDGNMETIVFADTKDTVRKGKNPHPVLGELGYVTGDVRKQIVVNLPEVADNSVYDPKFESSENSHDWLDKNGWGSRYAYVLANDGNIYKAYLKIAKSEDGRNILYSVHVNIKDGIAVDKGATQKRAAVLAAMPSKEIVTQEDSSVNKNLLRDDRNAEYGKKEFRAEVNALDEDAKDIVNRAYRRMEYAKNAATMTDKRFKTALGEITYGSKSKGYFTMIDPWDFLHLTTASVDKFLEQNQNRLNEGVSEDWGTPNNIEDSGIMFLRVSQEDGEWKVVGHEGRHRMAALYREGIDKASVIVITENAEADAKPIEIQRVKSQYNVGSSYLHGLIPGSKAYNNINRFIFAGEKSYGSTLKFDERLEEANQEVADLRRKLGIAEVEHRMAIRELNKQWDAEIDAIVKSNKYDTKQALKENNQKHKTDKDAALKALKAKYEAKIKQKDAEYKASVKDLQKAWDEEAKAMEVSSKYDMDERIKEHRKQVAELKKQMREAADKKMDSLKERYERNIENAKNRRDKTAMRHKIFKVVKELNDLLLHPDKKHHVPSAMQEAVAVALDAVNMDTVSVDSKKWELWTKMTRAESPEAAARYGEQMLRLEARGGKMSDKLTALHDAYEKFYNSEDADTAAAYDPVISSKIMDVVEKVGNTALADMSIDQMKAVYDMYKAVLKRIRDANKAFYADQMASISELRTAVRDELAEKKDRPKFSTAAKRQADKFSWNNEKPYYAFERIGSPTLMKLFKNLRASEDTWAVDMEEAKDFGMKAKDKWGYYKWDFDKPHTFTSIGGKDFNLNLEQILSLYAYSRRGEQAKDHIRKGGIVIDESTEVVIKNWIGIKKTVQIEDSTAYNIDDKTLDQIIDTLTPQQKMFVHEMQAYLSDVMGAKGNEVSMKLYDFKLFGEKFYWPLRSAQAYSARVKEQNQNPNNKMKNAGMTKATKPHAGNPIILTGFMDTWAAHVNEMSMYHATVLPMEDFYRVYNYSAFTDEGQISIVADINNKYGKAASDYIDQFLKDLNGGMRADPRETVFKQLVSKHKKAAVFTSASVVIQQPSAIARALAVIDARYFVGKKLDKLSHKQHWEQLKKYAPIAVIKEMGMFDTDMGRTSEGFLNAREYKGMKEKAMGFIKDSDYRDEILGWAPGFADEVAWLGIWDACQRQVLNTTKLTGEAMRQEAGKLFTETIMQTQVYDSVFSRSANMRSKSGLMSMVTSFMAEPTTTVNMLGQAVRKLQSGDKKGAARIVSSVAAATVLNSLLVSIVYAARDKDDDKNYWEKYMASFVSNVIDDSNPLTMMPGFRDVWSLFQGYDVERADMTLISDLASGINGIVKQAAKWDDNFTEEQESEFWHSMASKGMASADAVFSLMGIPEKNIRREINAIINWFQKSMWQTGSINTMKNAIWDEVRHTIPILNQLPGESKAERLIRAFQLQDQVFIDRQEQKFTSSASRNTSVKKAVRSYYEHGMSEEEAIKILMAVDAMKGNSEEEKLEAAYDLIREWDFNNNYGFSWSDRNDAYVEGKITRAQLKAELIEAGMTPEKAEDRLVQLDFIKEHPDMGDMTESGAKMYEAIKGQVSAEVFYDAFQFEKNASSDKDENGKTISGSKKAKIMDYINNLPISKSQKDALYLCWYKETTIDDAPWH